MSLGLLSNCLNEHVGWSIHVFSSCPSSPQSPAKLAWYPAPFAAERMVNWRDSDTILHQLEAFVKVVHFLTGVYIWEYISKLNFEWSIFRGRRKRSWTTALYVSCRVTTLAAAVAQMTGYDMTSPINCKPWLVIVRIFANISTTLALALYALRSLAIWQRNTYLLIFLITCLVVNVVLWMRLTVRPDTEWNEEIRTCVVTDVSRGLLNNASMFATEVILFVIILSGVYQRNSGRHILSTIYREGLIWLAIASMVQLLPVIFILLNLNDVMNLMFQTPAIICTGIGATRMYRGIFDRHAGDLLEYLESSQDAKTGEIRFRRQTISRVEHDAGLRTMSNALPMGGPRRALNEPYVERFVACEIQRESTRSEAHVTKIDPELVL